MYRGATKTMAPEEVSALVLSKMRDIAAAKLGTPVTKAVITGGPRAPAPALPCPALPAPLASALHLTAANVSRGSPLAPCCRGCRRFWPTRCGRRWFPATYTHPSSAGRCCLLLCLAVPAYFTDAQRQATKVCVERWWWESYINWLGGAGEGGSGACHCHMMYPMLLLLLPAPLTCLPACLSRLAAGCGRHCWAGGAAHHQRAHRRRHRM